MDDETLDELGEDFLEDLPDGALPVHHDGAAPSLTDGAQPPSLGEPAAKKLCSKGQSSDAGTSSVATATHSAPPPISHASYSNISAPLLLQSLTRNTQSTVDVIFSESPAEEVRAAVLARISSLINGQTFNIVIPSLESAASEALRLRRCTYSRHSYSWPSANDARIFRGLFLISVCLPNNRAMEVKVFNDPNQDFTLARARGDTHLVLHNVLLGYSPERMRATLLAGRTESTLPWLADLRVFHRLKDPYDESAYSQLLGIPVAADGDAGFDRIHVLQGVNGTPFTHPIDPCLVNLCLSVFSFLLMLYIRDLVHIPRPNGSTLRFRTPPPGLCSRPFHALSLFVSMPLRPMDYPLLRASDWPAAHPRGIQGARAPAH
ncbi:unnamed protein product [Closterium sp. Yama58-4]|nr:unnamed protein product [Closterium sp. Yama58-4]